LTGRAAPSYFTERLTKNLMTSAADRLSTTLSALADPTRRAILARLMLGEIAVGELAEPFDMTPPAISKHLKVLERAGLIARGREAQRRPCRLEAAPLREVSEWVAAYRQFWEQRLDRLEAYLQKAQATASSRKSPRRRKGKTHGRKSK
jgi:DNA-binding transcriptional ArsR family regulator